MPRESVPGPAEAGAGPPSVPVASRRILVLGYGNPGRRDDGLGPALAARLAALALPGVTVEASYQLSIEHAELAARHDLVVFVDAAADVPVGAACHLQPVDPAPAPAPFSHHLPPSAVLKIAADCFGARPAAWTLGIRPRDLETFAEELTPEAEANLAAALQALLRFIAPQSAPVEPGNW